VRGYYSFQGRRFDVARGSTVEFRGVQPINPRLDITGQRDVSGVIAEVHVQGTMRRPRLALSSQPPLDEADILSLIVFNEPINSLGEGEQAALLERAGNIAIGALATSLADSIGRALDVDLFEIRPSLSGEASTVDVGRQVNERLFVGFRQEFGQGDASRLSFEYRLTEALRVLTTFSQGADRSKRVRDRETAGIDLMFFIRY
jgi:translocation and assembly module TamB